MIICTGCKLRSASCSNFAFWCTRQSMAWHHVISTNCAFQFRLFITFLFFVLLLVAICSYPGQVTTWQPGILCGWSGHLEQCTTEHSFGTYIINFQKTCSRHIFSRVLTSWLTVWQSTTTTSIFIRQNGRTPERATAHQSWLPVSIELRTLYGTLVVTLAMLLRLRNCRFIVYYYYYYYYYYYKINREYKTSSSSAFGPAISARSCSVRTLRRL